MDLASDMMFTSTTSSSGRRTQTGLLCESRSWTRKQGDDSGPEIHGANIPDCGLTTDAAKEAPVKTPDRDESRSSQGSGAGIGPAFEQFNVASKLVEGIVSSRNWSQTNTQRAQSPSATRWNSAARRMSRNSSCCPSIRFTAPKNPTQRNSQSDSSSRRLRPPRTVENAAAAASKRGKLSNSPSKQQLVRKEITSAIEEPAATDSKSMTPVSVAFAPNTRFPAFKSPCIAVLPENSVAASFSIRQASSRKNSYSVGSSRSPRSKSRRNRV
jgi:hypothetical protein